MPETRKQEFVGTIKKCPNCGQVLESFQTRCPACGYEITGVDAANSVKGFLRLIRGKLIKPASSNSSKTSQFQTQKRIFSNSLCLQASR